MLAEIGSKANVPAYIKRVKNKEDNTRLMGFGHRSTRTTIRAPQSFARPATTCWTRSASVTSRCST